MSGAWLAGSDAKPAPPGELCPAQRSPVAASDLDWELRTSHCMRHPRRRPPGAPGRTLPGTAKRLAARWWLVTCWACGAVVTSWESDSPARVPQAPAGPSPVAVVV